MLCETSRRFIDSSTGLVTSDRRWWRWSLSWNASLSSPRSSAQICTPIKYLLTQKYMIILHPAHPRPYLPSISLSDGGGLQVIKEDIFTPHSLLQCCVPLASCWLPTAVVVVNNVVVTRVLGRSSGRHLPPLLLCLHTTAANTSSSYS